MLTLNRTELISILPKNGDVIEIGVDKGDFSKVILENANPKSLTLIDPWIEMLDIITPEASHQEKYHSVRKMFEKNPNVRIIRQSSADAAQSIEDNSVDWIYIDGDHKYEGCRLDLALYSQKVKQDGYICGHDWVTSEKKGFGVNQAVEEFIRETGFHLCGLTNESNFKSYVIAKTIDGKENLLAKIK